MNGTLMVFGQTGAACAEAVLHMSAAGLISAEALRLVLIGVPETTALRLQTLAEDYDEVREGFGSAAHEGFGPVLSVQAYPETEANVTPASLGREADDALLLNALLPADAQQQPGLSGTPAASALTWKALLAAPPEGALGDAVQRLTESPDTETVILCGSLCEAGAGAALIEIGEVLKRSVGESLSVGAVVFLPIARGDHAGLTKSTLLTRETPAQRLWMIGLPEDFREEASGAHLTHWLGARAVEGLLSGEGGARAFVAPEGPMKWSVFGREDGAKWRFACERYLRAAYLLLAEYGEPACRMIGSPNWLRDRLTGWYGAWFGLERKLTPDEREEDREDLLAAMRLMRRSVSWMEEVFGSLPFPMRFAGALHEAREAAEEQYRSVLELAGQLALVQSEMERSGMGRERVVHRHDMADSESEAAVKQMDELRETLQAAAEKQEELSVRMGGRARRAMLADAVESCAAEADDIRAQAEEAERRIDRAALIATAEEMPKVDAARARLERLSRHLTAMDGRTARAGEDLRAAQAEDKRLTPPRFGEDEPPQAEPAPVDTAWLRRLCELQGKEGRERKQLAAQLEQGWPWPRQPLAALKAAVAVPDDTLCECPAPARFLDHLLACCGGTRES